ncbi:flagellin [Methanoculleus sp. FWC-SCC1]|uniref:Flagellin n=1 Tax=Methanoculleus frigidifontis TaxID=2584085 RepID=A0ABT8M612_9EURY|nr:archaellin/type IV pilin N-terminal domain-containing protein [Methanoculleus sp. FWC-SCC1]MDN7023379.1 flagellin [Methanoculleus sp. FWC-SCC1]
MWKIKSEDAFTGLEAAIVLIAFVVVAAVFSYVVLGAGFFTTQKSQEVVHTGVQQASSSLEIIGSVYGLAADSSDLDYARFTIGNTAGGTALDVTQMLITYIDNETHQVMTYTADGAEISGNQWNVTARYNHDTDYLLEPGEQFVIMVALGSPVPNQPFSLNLQPAVGAVYPIERIVPPAIEDVNILN